MSTVTRLTMPDDPAARVRLTDPPCVATPIRQLDLEGRRHRRRDLGYRLRVDFSWIELPVLDASGLPFTSTG